MEISVGKHRETLVDRLVREGRFSSASEVVEEGLRLVEEQEKKLEWLRAKVQQAIAEGGEVSEDELDADLEAAAEDLRREGY